MRRYDVRVREERPGGLERLRARQWLAVDDADVARRMAAKSADGAFALLAGVASGARLIGVASWTDPRTGEARTLTMRTTRQDDAPLEGPWTSEP